LLSLALLTHLDQWAVETCRPAAALGQATVPSHLINFCRQISGK